MSATNAVPLEKRQFFNNSSHVGHVISDDAVVDPATLEQDPNKIDLRFFNRITLCDTYNGYGKCMNGSEVTVVLYGNRVVWQNRRIYVEGSHETGSCNGSGLYNMMNDASELYLAILNIGYAKFHGEFEEGASDTVYMRTPESFAMLKKHPQYLELIRDFGLKLIPKNARSTQFTVKISKSYERDPE